MDTSAFDIQSAMNQDLRSVAVHIHRTQSSTPSAEQKSILSKLNAAKAATDNYYVILSLEKLIKKVQTIVDSDIQSAPPATIVTALADIHTN
jgi:hypothetical protein